MALDKIKFYCRVVVLMASFMIRRGFQVGQGLLHRLTYRDSPSPKNVVVLGGSFAGIWLVKRLAETLPTGHRVVLVEKNSHLNFSFNFPRFSVVPGHDKQAFIPYDGIIRKVPAGIFKCIHGEATDITASEILLDTGEKVDYSYLAIATGVSQPFPAKVLATDREKACGELRTMQEAIKSANNIAIVGGGAVGVEIAMDIKSFNPEKQVTLVHSRKQLLPRFGSKLHDYAFDALKKQGVKVILQERPQIVAADAEGQAGSDSDKKALRFSDGRVEAFDLVIPCTGSSPNSKILAKLAPNALSKETNRILVKDTLQIVDKDGSFPHVFAFGDVAETGGPQMARAGYMQSEVVVQNILAMIQNKPPSTIYKPKLQFEGAIKLTLGKTDWVMYTTDENGTEMLIPGHNGTEDLEIEKGWKMLGADFKESST